MVKMTSKTNLCNEENIKKMEEMSNSSKYSLDIPFQFSPLSNSQFSHSWALANTWVLETRDEKLYQNQHHFSVPHSPTHARVNCWKIVLFNLSLFDWNFISLQWWWRRWWGWKNEKNENEGSVD